MVAAVGFETTHPTTKAQENQANPHTNTGACTAACTPAPKPDPDSPSLLARLLSELAALPPEQRATLAALLAPPTTASAPQAPTPNRPDARALDYWTAVSKMIPQWGKVKAGDLKSVDLR